MLAHSDPSLHEKPFSSVTNHSCSLVHVPVSLSKTFVFWDPTHLLLTLLPPWPVWGSLQVLAGVSETRLLKLERLVCLWRNIGTFIQARIGVATWAIWQEGGRDLSQCGRQY